MSAPWTSWKTFSRCRRLSASFEYGNVRKALSCVSYSCLPSFGRATTTRLVPTSKPSGCVPSISRLFIALSRFIFIQSKGWNCSRRKASAVRRNLRNSSPCKGRALRPAHQDQASSAAPQMPATHNNGFSSTCRRARGTLQHYRQPRRRAGFRYAAGRRIGNALPLLLFALLPDPEAVLRPGHFIQVPLHPRPILAGLALHLRLNRGVLFLDGRLKVLQVPLPRLFVVVENPLPD